jgi:hypothetical protein
VRCVASLQLSEFPKLWSLFDLPNIQSTTAIQGGPPGRSAALPEAQRSPEFVSTVLVVYLSRLDVLQIS